MPPEDSLATVTCRMLHGARKQVVEIPGLRLLAIAGPDKGHAWILPRDSCTFGKSSGCDIFLRLHFGRSLSHHGGIHQTGGGLPCHERAGILGKPGPRGGGWCLLVADRLLPGHLDGLAKPREELGGMLDHLDSSMGVGQLR